MASRLLQKDKFTVYRYANTGYYDDDGNWIDAEFVASPMVGCVQPDKGQYREISHNGVILSDYTRIQTKTLLQTADEHVNNVADRVLINDKLYEVAKVNPYLGLRATANYDVCVVLIPKGLE